MLRIDECGHPARLLRLGNHLERKRRLARRLRPEDLDDAAAGNSADAERIVDADGACGDALHRCNRATLAEAHDGSLAELFFDLTDSVVDGAGAFFQVVERHANSLGRSDDQSLHCGATLRDSPAITLWGPAQAGP